MDEGTLVKILRELSFRFKKVYIVIDALNESRSVKEVLQLVQDVREWDHPELHLTVTSRQLPEIEATLTSLVTNKVCLQESGMKSDIELYIDGKFATDKRLAKWPVDIRSQIKAKLLEPDCGVYVYLAAVKISLTLLDSNGLYANSTCYSDVFPSPQSGKPSRLAFRQTWKPLMTISG